MQQISLYNEYYFGKNFRSLSRMIGMGSNVVYVDELTIGFIESILKKSISNIEHCKLVAFQIDEKKVQGGLMGTLSKIYLKWDSTFENENLPRSLVMKTVKDSFDGLKTSIEMVTTREVDYYNYQLKLQGNDKQREWLPFLPAIYYTFKNAGGAYSIIMQDISGGNNGNNKFISVCLALGNQCWDLPEDDEFNLNIYNPFSIVDKCFDAALNIHLENWRNNDLIQTGKDKNGISMQWLKNIGIYQGDKPIYDDRQSNLLSIWNKTTKPKVEKFKADIINADQTIEVFDNYFANYSSWDENFKRTDIADESVPYTVCHGDFHGGNIMINQDGSNDNLYLFDWSEVGVGCPFSDLSQFVISNCSIEFRRSKEEQLFKNYHTKLIDSQSSTVSKQHFTLDHCFKIYKRGGIERWIMINILMSPFIPDNGFIYFFNQLSTFIKDHYSNDLFN